MIYKQTECKMGDYFYSFCTNNLGAHYPVWVIPCFILKITPAELAVLLQEEYNAILHYSKVRYPFVSTKWESQVDMRKWKNFINKKAREINYQI